MRTRVRSKDIFTMTAALRGLALPFRCQLHGWRDDARRLLAHERSGGAITSPAAHRQGTSVVTDSEDVNLPARGDAVERHGFISA